MYRFGENRSREAPDKPDYHIVRHLFKEPGHYVVSVKTSNVFNTLSASLPHSMIVQNPLVGGNYTLQPLPVSAVALPPGSVTLDARLVRAVDGRPANLTAGWADDVHVKWKLTEQNFMMLEAYGAREVGTFVDFAAV